MGSVSVYKIDQKRVGVVEYSICIKQTTLQKQKLNSEIRSRPCKSLKNCTTIYNYHPYEFGSLPSPKYYVHITAYYIAVVLSLYSGFVANLNSLVYFIYSILFSILGAIHSLYYPWEEFEEISKDPNIKNPEAWMLKHKRKHGQYQGCFSSSKWGGQRKKYKWDTLVQCAEKMSKVIYEVPNVLRPVLGITTMKARGLAAKRSTSSLTTVPEPLAHGIEQLVLERVQCGEEVTKDYVGKLFVHMNCLWNQHVSNFREKAAATLGQWALKDADDVMTDEPTGEEVANAQHVAAQAMEHAMASLLPFEVSKHPKAMEYFGVFQSLR